MVGKVLTSNGVVEPIKEGRKIVGYRLTSYSLTEAQRASLAHLCQDEINDFIKGRGATIWDHRGPDSGYVSGSIRYQVLKRAKYRCELCAAYEGQAALYVDHIIPRSKRRC